MSTASGMSDVLYVLFAGEDYYPRGGFQDKIEHTYSRSENRLQHLIERARGYAATSDFFYKGMPEKNMVGVEYKHISWWHIVEFSSRGMVIVAQAQGGGDEPWEEDFTEEEV